MSVTLTIKDDTSLDLNILQEWNRDSLRFWDEYVESLCDGIISSRRCTLEGHTVITFENEEYLTMFLLRFG